MSSGLVLIRKSIRLTSVSLTFLVLVLLFQRGSAQSPSTENLAIHLQDGQISLYAVDTLGQFTLIETFSGFNLVNLSYSIETEWEIAFPSDIVPSPDRNHIAFTGVSSSGETALFLYTQGRTGLHQVVSPGIGSISWSSKNDALLIYPPDVPTSNAQPFVQDVYLYILESKQFINITNTPQAVEREVKWLPDGNHIVYAGPLNSCTPPCTFFRDLIIYDRITQVQIELVDLDSQLPVSISVPSSYAICFPHDMLWLTVDQRIYYAVSCIDTADQTYSVLFSVDLLGNNRLEVDLPALYPDEVSTSVEGLDANDSHDSLYVLVNSRFVEEIDAPQLVGRWRIFTNRTGQWTLLTEPNEASPWAVAMAISPDEQQLAIGGQTPRAGFLATVNLSSGQISSQAHEYAVCQTQWLDNDTLLYTDFVGCGTGFNAPSATWSLDTNTGSSIQMTGGLSGVTWLLPDRDIESINLSPDAHAGPDQTVTALSTGTASVSLDGSSNADSDGTITAYRWYKNNILIAEGVTPQVELGVGVHTITLTVVDDDGAIDIDDVAITVEAPFTCTVTIGNGVPDTIYLRAGTFTLNAVDNNTDGPNGLPSITSEITRA